MKNTFSIILKRVLQATAVIIGLFIMLQVCLYIYFQNNKDIFQQQIIEILEDEINGNISFDDIDISFFKNFPTTAIRINKLVVSDSLFDIHKIKAIEVDEIFLQVGTYSIIKGTVAVNKLTVTNGTLNFFTDSSNYSNLRIFPQKENDAEQDLRVKNLEIENIRIIITDVPKNKKIEFLIEDSETSIKGRGMDLDVSSKLVAKVAELSFNRDRGGFLVNQNVKGRVNFILDRKTLRLKLSETKFSVEGQEIDVSGVVFKVGTDTRFDLQFHAPEGKYKTLLAGLPTFHQKKLNKLEVENEIDIKAFLKGKFNYPDTPDVRITISTKNNSINSEAGTLSNASFDYEFHNWMDTTRARTDENSYIAFRNLSATWKKIPFRANKLTIVNLIQPFLKTDVKSSFKSELLNTFTEGTMDIQNGNAQFELKYSGPLLDGDKRKRSLNGNLSIRKADIIYTPHQAKFTNCDADILFKGNDVLFKKVRMQRSEDLITMTGSAQDFLNYYFNEPKKIEINWKVEANTLHIENYLSFINKDRNSNQGTSARKMTNVSRKLADFTDQSTMRLELDANDISYKNFTSSNVNAAVSIYENTISIDKAKMKFKTGTIEASGEVDIASGVKDFSLQTKVQSVDIPNLLQAADNFGQPTFNKSNSKGKINLTGDITGKMNKDASLKPNTLTGKLHIDIQNGQLTNFIPLKKLEKFILRSRDLANLDIRDLSLDFSMKNGLINLPLTEVNTSVLNVFMKGTYGAKSGTDLALLIPLRNPKRDEIREAKGMDVDKKRGLKLYLKAQDDETGTVKFSWMKRSERPSFGK